MKHTSKQLKQTNMTQTSIKHTTKQKKPDM